MAHRCLACACTAQRAGGRARAGRATSMANTRARRHGAQAHALRAARSGLPAASSCAGLACPAAPAHAPAAPARSLVAHGKPGANESCTPSLAGGAAHQPQRQPCCGPTQAVLQGHAQHGVRCPPCCAHIRSDSQDSGLAPGICWRPRVPRACPPHRVGPPLAVRRGCAAPRTARAARGAVPRHDAHGADVGVTGRERRAASMANTPAPRHGCPQPAPIAGRARALLPFEHCDARDVEGQKRAGGETPAVKSWSGAAFPWFTKICRVSCGTSYTLYCQALAAILIWLAGPGIRWAPTLACTVGRSFCYVPCYVVGHF